MILKERRNTDKKPLPLPNDIKKLAEYFQKEIGSFNRKDMSYQNFRKGVMLAEAKLITYNRRRSGEVQALR